jgi:hypothetical protein
LRLLPLGTFASIGHANNAVSAEGIGEADVELRHYPLLAMPGVEIFVRIGKA